MESSFERYLFGEQEYGNISYSVYGGKMEEEFKNTIKRDNESGYYSVASFRSEFVLDRAMVNIESKETIGLSQSAKSNNSIAKNLATINEEPRVHRGQQLVKT